ncbi:MULTISPECIES: hypothetical protein [Prosthecochloris]|nr:MULTISPECIES: hypothetical protein [Prosthecochloris]
MEQSSPVNQVVTAVGVATCTVPNPNHSNPDYHKLWLRVAGAAGVT